MASRLPPVDPKLIEWLAASFPNRVPAIDESEREIWAKVGEQRVIDRLRLVVVKTLKENLAT